MKKLKVIDVMRKEGRDVLAAEEFSNSAFGVTELIGGREVGTIVKIVELNPAIWDFENITIPGIWKKKYGLIIFLDEKNTIFLKTTDMRKWPQDFLLNFTTVSHINLYKLGYKEACYVKP